MSLELLKIFFMWTTILHFSILIIWVILLKVAEQWFRRQQSWWFPIPQEHFMSLHYVMYGGYKLMAMVFSVVPLLALLIIEKWNQN